MSFFQSNTCNRCGNPREKSFCSHCLRLEGFGFSESDTEKKKSEKQKNKGYF